MFDLKHYANVYLIVISTLLLLFSSLFANAQSVFSEKEIKEKTDSILSEGNLLYKYERAAWVSTDMVKGKENIKKDFGGYFVYKVGDTIKTIILDSNNTQCIYELLFFNDFNIPKNENLTRRKLTSIEANLLNIKNKIINEIIEKKYEVNCPKGFSLNIELIPIELGYKLYILTGTSQSQMIPFGNDYLFYADVNGDIILWKKFHSSILYTPTKELDGEVIKQTIHSHLKTEPYITATDICTFKLYGSLYGQKDFLVYSPILLKYFKYKLFENEIEVLEVP